MELTAEQITELGLTEDNTSKVSTFLSDQIANTKQEFEGLANKNAEKILDGALGKVFTDTKIARVQGEKAGDYIPRAWNEFNTSKIAEIETLKSEYGNKIKDFKGNEDLVSKITGLESDKDNLLQKYANYDELKSKAELYDPLQEKYEANKLQVAFSGIKPNFPKEANVYEVNAKWNEFKKGVLDNYTIEYVEGEAVAIDNENKFKQVKLSDLLSKDTNITSLMAGRQQEGTGSKEVSLTEIEGVPFKVPKDLDSEGRTKLIRDHLASQGLKSTDSEYPIKFAKLNKAILSKK